MESRLGWPIDFVSHSEKMDRAEEQVQNSTLTVLSIVFLTITATVVLLASYYLIITKCSSNCCHTSLPSCLSTLYRWRVTNNNDGSDDSFIAFSPPLPSQGLDDSLIRQIPTFQFSSSGRATYHQRSHGCMVCLNEFREQDMLKLLPGCSHVFHFDCINLWLQTNCSCPICRTNIAVTATHLEDNIAAPSSSPQDSEIHSGSLTGRGDEDFIVIELWRGDRAMSFERQASGSSRRWQSISDRSEKTEIELLDLKQKPCRHASTTEVVEKERDLSPFQIQPLRRSFSLDSVSDMNLYLLVQASLQQSSEGRKLCRSQEHGRNLRSIIMLPYGCGSKTAVLPVDSET